MFRNGVTIEHREAALDAVLRGGSAIGLLRAQAEVEVVQRRLAAERAVDAVLADSFPASDPPSWTLGVIPQRPERPGTNDGAGEPDRSQAALVRDDVNDVSRATAERGTFIKGLVTLAGTAGAALLWPLIILSIGTPVARAVRGASRRPAG